jgi:hypothetical protein
MSYSLLRTKLNLSFKKSIKKLNFKKISQEGKKVSSTKADMDLLSTVDRILQRERRAVEYPGIVMFQLLLH